MFDIEYKGGNTIIISTKKAKLITDAKQSLVGLKDVNTKDAVAVSTEARFALNSPDALLNIESPGEYEVSDFSIKGVAAKRHIDAGSDANVATVYRIEIGDTRIALIGNVEGQLSEVQLEELGVIDIAILPVGGGGYTLDATSAAQLARSLEAKVIIPVHYADKALKYEVSQESLDVFIKELGIDTEQSTKYKVKSAISLPASMLVVELTRS